MREKPSSAKSNKACFTAGFVKYASAEDLGCREGPLSTLDCLQLPGGYRPIADVPVRRLNAHMRSLGCLIAGILLFVGAPASACQRLPSVYFRGGSIVLNPDAHASLQVFAQRALAHLDRIRSIRVVGHSDRTGTARARERISLRRAEVVRSFLIANGIPARLLLAARAGDTEPLTDPSDNVREPLNRRVELKLTLSERDPGQPDSGCPGRPSPLPSHRLEVPADQQADAQEADYVACLDAAAQHYGALAGRAGTGVGSAGDPFADCRNFQQAWRDALARANPQRGLAAAEARINVRMVDIGRRVSARMNQAYQDNNYE